MSVATSQTGRSGVFRPTKDTAIPWTINEFHTLIWNGTPYIPVGVRVDADSDSIKAAIAEGAKDLIVDMPDKGAVWNTSLATLLTANAHYLLRLDGVAPIANGFTVAPQVYRLTGITSTRLVTMDIPGAKSAFVVLAVEQDGTIRTSERVPVVDGKVSYLAKLGNDLPHALYVYPDGTGNGQIDWWEGMDQHRDEVMASLRRAKPGPGLRGIVNPLGRMVSPPGREVQVVPDSITFRAEFRRALATKYQSVDNVQRAWAMRANKLNSLEELCRLVPLWSGKRGVPFLWDPTTNELYQTESAKCRIWQDVTEVVNAAATRRQERMVRAIRRVVDVPVIQEWNGWSTMYDADVPAIDGIGARVSGKTGLAIAESACRATSSILRWSTRGWLLATDVDPESTLDDILAIGPRAVFYRTTKSGEAKKLLSAAIDPAQASQTVQALLYPENASNPASPQRLPLGMWWIPTPLSGNRLDLGNNFFAYRVKGTNTSEVVIWAKRAGRYRMRLANAKNATFMALDGQDPKPKFLPTGVELNLSTYPTVMRGVDDYPVPEAAYLDTIAEFTALSNEADRLRRDITEEKFFFADFVKSFEKSPAGSLSLMRQSVYKAAHKLGIVWWFEAENASNTNFSEAVKLPGCSAEGALDLHAAPIVPDGGFFVQFSLTPTNANYDVWISAKIPAERRGDVSVAVGGQILTIVGEPTGVYANGFGWYRLGSVKLSGGGQKLRVSVIPTQATEISLDCVVLSSVPFKPDGISHPDSRGVTAGN